MVSRPVVAAPLVGFILGNTAAGVGTAVLFELLWLGRPPLGGYIPPDVTLGSVATTAVAASVPIDGGASTHSVVFLSFVGLLPLSFLGVRVDKFHRRLLGRVARSVECAQHKTGELAVMPSLGLALVTGFAFAFLLLFPAIVGGSYLIRRAWLLLPPGGDKILGLAYYVVPVLGVAEMIAIRKTRAHRVLFLIGIAMTLGVGVCWGIFFKKP